MVGQILKNQELESYVAKVKATVVNAVNGTVPEVEEYVNSTFGKHVRSKLFYLTTKALDPSVEVPVEVGAAFELLHTATLMHDDILDNGKIRRGQKSFFAKHGTNHSILAGDLLVCSAVDLVWQAKSWKFVKLYAELGKSLVQGEFFGPQLKITDSISKYYAHIRLKTASFFETICKMATIVTNKDKTPCNSIIIYGENFGKIFQVKDDYVDYFVNRKLKDKPVGGDFYNKSITLPLLLAYKDADPTEKRLILTLISSPDASSFKMLKKIMRKLNIEELIQNELEILSDQAIFSLNELPDSQYKDILKMLVQV